MIDVGRFMQDGVGDKKTQYEKTIVGGEGTFVANGKIVCAVGSGIVPSGNNIGMATGTGYIFPPESTETAVLQNSTYWGCSTNFTYVNEKSVSYAGGNVYIIVSEKA